MLVYLALEKVLQLNLFRVFGITYTLIRNAQNAKLAYLAADTYVFKYDANSSLVGAAQATLTAQVQGVTITAWTKSNKGSNGASGANAIVFSVYAPEGTVVINQSGSLALAWAKYTGGEWEDISDETSSTLSVSGADIVNIQSYRCTMTYKGNTYGF